MGKKGKEGRGEGRVREGREEKGGEGSKEGEERGRGEGLRHGCWGGWTPLKIITLTRISVNINVLETTG